MAANARKRWNFEEYLLASLQIILQMLSDHSLLRRAHEWADRRIHSGPIILMYHRVAEVAQDPWGLCVSPANFAAQLDVLMRRATPVPLEWLTDPARRHRLPRRSVAVTFDDGYTDVLYTAKPLLEAMEVPATTFITTGNLGSNREFWWDELERLLLCPGTLPPNLELTIKGQTHRWELGEAAQYSEADAQQDRFQRSYAASAGTRHALYHAVWQQLFRTPEEERQHVLAALNEWAGDVRSPRAGFRSLSPDEVEMLARGGLVEIGAHTVTHPALSAHAATVQRFEITESKRALEQILEQPITSFAYPHGDYSRETITLLREAGLRRACTIRDGRVARRNDPLQLPRHNVENWTAPEFEEHLSEWLGESVKRVWHRPWLA